MFGGVFSAFKKEQTANQRWQPIVERINALEPEFESLSDEQLKAKTDEFRQRLQQQETVDDLLPEAFAAVREAAKRSLDQRHYDVQLLGGIGLHHGMVIEMMTGEGKTLVATLPVYLNALAGQGVHVVTVNDYLAQRDTVWMGQIYDRLGLSVACLVHSGSLRYTATSDRLPITDVTHATTVGSRQSAVESTEITDESFRVHREHLIPISRQEAYATDITYGTNHEFGFDYLRDNLATDPKALTQRGLSYAIIDEVDSILVDEARTPLIISAYERESEQIYKLYDQIARTLVRDEHFTIDEKKRAAYLTEDGQAKIETVLGYNPYLVEDLHAVHHLEQALKANQLFKRDKDYIVRDQQVIIVDEFTGRLMIGRRWSGGLHQAVEAKENVPVQPESKTVASVTIQNLFRKYHKRAGMTGTAATSAEEFYRVYGMEVITIPPNKACVRRDQPDRIYINQKAKWTAIVTQIAACYEQGRPVLVGTTSIEKSELIAQKLKEKGVPHQVLNAKQHEAEGQVIAQAGRIKAVTVATNMAGRGVDIILGGLPVNTVEADRVRALGGLLVIGTERHEARRIDNQLRGRVGRQGDPGESIFYLSLEDDLMRIFGGEAIKKLVERLKFPETESIEHPMITKAILEAQTKVEGLNFDLRKHLLEYDDIVNAQREKIYDERRQLLLGQTNIEQQLEQELAALVADDPRTVRFVVAGPSEASPLQTEAEEVKDEAVDSEPYREKLEARLGELRQQLGDGFIPALRFAMLQIYDYLWSEHLSYLDEIKESVGYRAYGQRDPLVEFKREALDSFDGFHRLFRINFFQYLMRLNADQAQTGTQINADQDKKPGRNDPCPCGAKRADGTAIKYKHCHGK